MRIVTASGQVESVGGGSAAARPPAPTRPAWATHGAVRLARGKSGRARSIRFAEVARTNPWVRAAVDIRGSLASRVPLHVFRPHDDERLARRGDRIRVRPGDPGPGGSVADLLSSPADRLSRRRWARRLLQDILVHDNALVELVRSGSQIVELRWQPWVDVDWHCSRDGLQVEAWEVPVERRDGLWLGGGRPRGDTRLIDRNDAIHLVPADEVGSEVGPVGVSKLAAMHYTLALHDAAMRFAVSYLDNGVFPTGVVELHQNATPEVAQATRELLEALHTRVERAGAPVAVAGKWHQVMASPEGARLLELAKWSREEVAGGFRIPLPVLGDVESTNRSTSQSSREQLVRDVVGDDVAVLESELQAQLIAPSRRLSAAGVWVEAQLAELLRPDMVAMSQVLHREVGGPVLTANEGRQLIGKGPLDDPRADRLVLNPGTPDADIDPDDPDDPDDV